MQTPQQRDAERERALNEARKIILERRQLFQSVDKTVEGHRVFEELRKLFGDKPSYIAGDPHQTSFNEGARSVWIMIRTLLAPEPEFQEAMK